MTAGDQRGERTGLIFGIFAGISGAEYSTLSGGLELYDPAKTDAALTRLQSAHGPFVVRAYGVYHGRGRVENITPPDFTRYFHGGRQLEYTLAYRSSDGDLADWTRALRQTIAQVGTSLSALQVAEEPNNPDPATGGDGASSNVIDAVVEGVLAARDEIAARGLRLAVGVNAAPSFNPEDRFWPTLVERGGPDFVAALDYVGLDFFPDVFRPLPTPDFPGAVEGVVGHFRNALSAVGIPEALPIRITENGWPTSPSRSPRRQAEVLEAIVRAIHGLRERLNVTHYEFFALRDAVSGARDALTEWGLLRSDYSPKPAFETYRRLIAELGESAPKLA
jgi:hypothetical protein